MDDGRVKKLNPSIPMTSNSGHGVRSSGGSLDSSGDTGGMNATVVVIPNGGDSMPAPANPPWTWSADSQYDASGMGRA